MASVQCRVQGRSLEEGRAAKHEMEEGFSLERPGAVPKAEPADAERMEGVCHSHSRGPNLLLALLH
ncbi:hypothetical protein CRG98_048968, partial [Punica granatum]